MKTYNDFKYSTKSSIDGAILDSLSEEEILSVSLKIKASHAGKVNGNDVFYTPRSMKKGATTLTIPFKKHLQDLHHGDAVGEINGADYQDYTDRYSAEFRSIASKIDSAQTPSQLVKAVKELVNHPEYSSTDYKGLGVIQVSAELFDEPLIDALATGSNKGKVSIGGNSRQVYCSICAELFNKKHKHVKGKTYGGEECFAIYDDMVLDHIGFVPDPADDTTETVIVAGIQDSIEENDISVSIEKIKIQDNKQGIQTTMKIEEFKQLLKSDSKALVNLVEGLTDAQKDSLVELYSTSTKNLRASSYLFTEDKLLAIKTKEQVALAKLALELLEDSKEKEALVEMLKVHEAKHLVEDEDLQAFLTTLVTEDAVADAVADLKEAVEEGQEAKAVEDVVSDLKEVYTQFSPEALDDLVSKVATAVVAAIKPIEEEKTAIKDSLQFDTLLNRLNQLELDIAAVDASNAELTSKYKASIIGQILLHKGISSDDEYASKLQERDTDSLQLLLEDVQYDLSRLAKTTEKVEAQPAEENTPAVVEAPIQDSVQKEQVELEKATIADSLDAPKDADLDSVIEDSQQTDKIDPIQAIKSMGAAKYFKNLKK